MYYGTLKFHRKFGVFGYRTKNNNDDASIQVLRKLCVGNFISVKGKEKKREIEVGKKDNRNILRTIFAKVK